MPLRFDPSDYHRTTQARRAGSVDAGLARRPLTSAESNYTPGERRNSAPQRPTLASPPVRCRSLENLPSLLVPSGPSSQEPISRTERLQNFCASLGITEIHYTYRDASHAQLALRCAERDAKKTAAHAHLFVLPDEHVRTALAEVCAKVAPLATANNLYRFAIFSQAALSRVALACMASHSPPIDLLERFGIKDEKTLLPLVLAATIKGAKNVARHVDILKAAGIRSEEGLWMVAESCAEHGVPSQILVETFTLQGQQARMATLAALHAKHVYYEITADIKNLGINNQYLLGNIAKAAISYSCVFPKTFFADLRLTDLNVLIDVARVYARGGQLAENIKSFGIHDQCTLRDLAILCASCSPDFVRYFRDFGIQDARERYCIAAISARTSEFFPYYVEAFNISEESHRFDLASVAARGGHAIGQNILNFKIEDSLRRFEIAKLCAAHCTDGVCGIHAFALTAQEESIVLSIALARDSASIARFIKEFDLQDKDKPNVVLRCAEIDPATAQYIENFCVLDPSILAEVAMRCAQNYGYSSARYFRNFGIVDPSVMEAVGRRLIECGVPGYLALDAFDYPDEAIIIRLTDAMESKSRPWMRDFYKTFSRISEQGRFTVACKLAAKGICGLADAFEIVKISDPLMTECLARLAARHDQDTPRAIKNFGITDLSFLKDLAKLCADNSCRTAEYIENFKIQDPEVLFDVANRCAKRAPAHLAEHMERFAPLSQKHRRDLAMLCAESEPLATARYLHRFGLARQDDVNAAFARCLANNSLCLAYAQIYGVHLSRLGKIALNAWEAGGELWPLEEFHAAFAEIVKQFAHCRCGWMIDALRNSVNQHAQEQLALRFAGGLLAVHLFCRPEQVFALESYGLLRACFASPSAQNAIRFAMHLGRTAARTGALSQFATMLPLRRENRKTAAILIRAFLAGMRVNGVDGVDSLQSRLNCSDFSRALKKTARLHALLNVLIGVDEATLPSARKISVLAEIKDFTQIRALSVIFTLGEQDVLTKSSDVALDALAARVITENVAGQRIDKCVDRYFETFGSSSDPDAIWRYQRSIQETREPSMIAAFDTYITSVLRGVFQEVRHDVQTNQHLAKLEALTPGITAKFAKSFESQTTLRREAAEWNARTWLQKKLVDDKNFLHMVGLSHLHAFLFEGDEGAVGRCRLEPYGLTRSLQMGCFDLAHAEGIERQIKALSSMRSGLHRLNLQNTHFGAEVDCLHAALVQQNRVENKARKVRVVDTSDPVLLLLCGTQVPGSCQSVDSEPGLNRGLLAYLLNGQVRMLAALDEHERILARCMLLLLSDGEKPVVFLESLYGDARFAGAIRAMARSKADAMHIPLAAARSQADDAERYGRPLKSFGGISPWQYSDAAKGLFAKGVFVVDDAVRL